LAILLRNVGEAAELSGGLDVLGAWLAEVSVELGDLQPPQEGDDPFSQ
jgi:hypothetical protein